MRISSARRNENNEGRPGPTPEGDMGRLTWLLLLAVLSTAVMIFVNGIESRLPGRSVLEITVTFTSGHRPDFDEIVAGAQARGYRLQRDTLSIKFADSRPVWKFVAVAVERSRAMSPAELAEGLSALEGIASFGIVPVRN